MSHSDDDDEILNDEEVVVDAEEDEVDGHFPLVTSPPAITKRRARPIRTPPASKIKHSFSNLIKDATTGISSTLADESFWVASSKMTEDPPSSSLHSDIASLTSTFHDDSMFFMPQETPRVLFSLPRCHFQKITESDYCLAKDAIIDILFPMSKDSETFEDLLTQGVLLSILTLGSDSFPDVLLDNLRNNLFECFCYLTLTERKLSLANCVFKCFALLCNKALISTLNPFIKKDAASENANQNPPNWIADFLSPVVAMTVDILSISMAEMTEMDLFNVFTFLLAVCFDVRVYQQCWEALIDLTHAIIEWLDHDRLCLISSWLSRALETLNVQSDTVDGLLRLCKLLLYEGSSLGRSAARLLLDEQLTMSRNIECDLSDFTSQFRLIINSLIQQHTEPFTHKDLIAIYPSLRLLTERLLLTAIADSTESKALATSLSALKDLIPVNHYPLFIAVRDLVIQMQSHLQLSLHKEGKKSAIEIRSYLKA